MENKLIRCYKLSKWNIVTVSFYILLSFFLWFYRFENKFNPKETLFFYGFGTQFFIYGFQYRALRNFNYFLIWIVIAIFHFCIFLAIKDLPELAWKDGRSVAIVLRNTIMSLLLFQSLRYISLKLQDKELVVPSKNSTIDALDGRKVTTIDTICFIIYVIVTLFFIIKI